jgi:hypothetical protein
VANEFNLDEREIVDTLEKWGQLPDTIKYIQLGNPEQVLIASEYSPPSKKGCTGPLSPA